MGDCFAVSWHDPDYELVEWDIIAVGAIAADSRLTSNVAAFCDDENREDFIEIDYNGLRGMDANLDAFYVAIAGPFWNDLQAQYYIDGNVMPEEDY